MTKNNLKRLLGSQNNPFKDSSGCVSGFTEPNKNIICSFKSCYKIGELEHFTGPDWVGRNHTQVLMSPQNCLCHPDGVSRTLARTL